MQVVKRTFCKSLLRTVPPQIHMQNKKEVTVFQIHLKKSHFRQVFLIAEKIQKMAKSRKKSAKQV